VADVHLFRLYIIYNQLDKTTTGVFSLSSKRFGFDDKSPLISVFPPVVTILRAEFFPLIADDFLPLFRDINDDFVPKKSIVFRRCFENVKQKRSVRTIKNNGLSIPST
jgi:hypothetical protein